MHTCVTLSSSGAPHLIAPQGPVVCGVFSFAESWPREWGGEDGKEEGQDLLWDQGLNPRLEKSKVRGPDRL